MNYLVGFGNSFDSAYCSWMNWIDFGFDFDCHSHRIELVALDIVISMDIVVARCFDYLAVVYAAVARLHNQLMLASVTLIGVELVPVEMIVAFVALNRCWPVFDCPLANDSVLCDY